jgi:hypothetical protein
LEGCKGTWRVRRKAERKARKVVRRSDGFSPSLKPIFLLEERNGMGKTWTKQKRNAKGQFGKKKK